MLHIHNGGSTAGTLRAFGFPGEHFAFQEVLMAGPTPQGFSPGEWRTLRARFLANEYDLTLEDRERDLLEQDEALGKFSEHEEVVLWFEHDLFCQINLIYLLDWFSKQPPCANRLSLICIGEFPGVEDFRGLGQLTGEQLASLFDLRHEVTEAGFSTAARAWAAYCSSDLEDIARLLDDDTSALPFLRNALRLHLARFPSVRNGLGRVENLALKLISNGAVAFKSLFPMFAKEQPDYGMGDLQLWCELKQLGNARQLPISVSGIRDDEPGSRRFHEALSELTESGRSILAGERDFIEMNRIDLWLGGVHLTDASMWRWDEQGARLKQKG